MTAFNGNSFGSIEVIWGSMYSGKSEELQRQMDRARYGGKKWQLFKPEKDNRYNEEEVVTHYGKGLKAEVVKSSFEILSKIDKDTKVVGIDEGQFFDYGLIDVCKKLKRDYHIEVYVSGLDMKFNGEPFPVMMELASISNQCKKFQAVCVRCGEDAYISHRLTDDDSDIVVGSEGVYVALCEKHHLLETKK